MIVGFDMFDTQFFDCNLSAGSEISRVDISNVKIDTLKIDTGTSTGYNNQKSQQWDYDTVFDCKFNDLNFEAGNLSLNGMPIEYLRIKKRKENEITWQTYKNIAYDSDETNYTWSDYFVQSLMGYEIAICATGAGGIEGEYGIASIDCEYDDLYILGSNNVQYRLQANINLSEIANNSESNYITTLGGQYPIEIRNSVINYKKTSIKAMLVSDSTLNGYGTIDKKAERELRENIYNFLTNGKAKVLKDSSGLYMLTSISPNSVKITPNNDLSRQIAEINFDVIEIGDVFDSKTLTNAGLLI